MDDRPPPGLDASRFLDEDAARNDVTSAALVPEGALGSAVIRAKEAGVVAGLGYAGAVFAALDARIVLEA